MGLKRTLKTTDTRPLLCGHPIQDSMTQGSKQKCQNCGSFWDLQFQGTKPQYSADYPEFRLHLSLEIGALKIKSLLSWLGQLSIQLSPLSVCEVGFGGAYCLKYLSDNAKNAVGIEISDRNIEHAIHLGVPSEDLYNGSMLPSFLPYKIDLWIFQDSYEHLLDPENFLVWAIQNSNAGAQFIIIAPEANSLSERLLGSFWLHRIPDHLFHWSRKGLVAFLKTYHLELIQEFSPKKYVSLKMIFRHLCILFGILFKTQKEDALIKKAFWRDPTFCFNIGEMGLLFKLRAPIE